MRRLMCKTKVYIIAIIVLAFVFTLVLFFPAAGAEPEDDSIEIKSSEAWVLETTTTGTIESARMITWFDMKGDGTTDVTKDNTLEEDTKWQGVHGFTAPVVEDDYLVWKNVKVDSNANVLSATEIKDEDLIEDVSMRIPLDLHYEYWFDEEGDNKDIMMKVSPEDIVGKSGHFRLDLTMTNTSDEMTAVEYEDPDTGEMIEGEVETYLPLVILPYDWYFPNDVFFDLKTDPTGVVVYVPEHYQLGWSIPLFPPATERSHTIWVEADVKNFEMPTLVLSANFVFPETNQIDTMPVFVSGFEQLYDGIKQVNEGIGVTDIESEETLLYGITAVKDGLEQMAEGLPEAVENINNQMIPGVAEAVEGIGSPGTPDTLRFAIDQSTLGMIEMVAGIGGPNVNETLLFGLSAASEGLLMMKQGAQDAVAGIGSAETPDTLLYAGDQVSMGLEEIVSGIGAAAMEDTLLFGIDQLMQGMLEMKAGIGPAGTSDTLMYAMAAIGDGLKDMLDGIGAADDADTMLFGLAQMAGGLNEMLAGIGSAGDPDTLLFGVDQVMTGVSSGSSADPGILEGVQQIRDGLAEVEAGTSETSELRQALGLIRILAPWTGPFVDQLENGIIFGTPDEPSLHQAAGLMKDGADDLIDGIGSIGTEDTLLYGLDQIRGGLEEMKFGIGHADIQDTLLYAIAQVQGGLEQMKAGIGSSSTDLTLLFAVDQVQQGLDLMLSGIGSATTPDTALYGLVQVEDGLELMKAGIGAENADDTLLYGINAMSDGLLQMKEGMIEMDAGIGSVTTADSLLYAIAQVSNGMELMKEGIGAEGAPDTLLYAMAQVQHGLALMQAGLSTGDMNDPGLKEGLILVSSGLGDAVEGLGSESTEDTLIYGADQVKGGLEQVAEGTLMMEQGLMDNLGMLYLTGEQLEAIKVRGDEFDHIMGRADDADNVVTFIYQTPPTYGYKNGSSWKIAGILSLLILLVLILGGILLARRPVAG